MYVAMNRFRVVPGKEQAFIDVWKNRDSQLKEAPGFKEFKLLQGCTNPEFTLFASHVIWDSEEHFDTWVKSEAFQKSHASAGSRKEMYVGPPQFEGFKAVL
jgi:heme-degrading monooxygenase HmoA